MREIKVRGYAVDEMVGSQWVYGTGVHRTVFTEEFAKECGQSGETFIWTESGWVLVHDESVSVYTGLNDKNGNEIFEGDVYSYELYKVFISGGNVEESISRGTDVVEFKDGAFYHGDELLSDVITHDDTFAYEGNIYENPELLEVAG